MLCCLEEARRYNKYGSHDGQLWHNNCKRIYVLHMIPNKNVKVTELSQNIEILPFFVPPHQNPRNKFLPLTRAVWNLPHPSSSTLQANTPTPYLFIATTQLFIAFIFLFFLFNLDIKGSLILLLYSLNEFRFHFLFFYFIIF